MKRFTARHHLLALTIAALVSLPVLAATLAAGLGTAPAGRVLAIGPPWRSGTDALAALALAGADWGIPLGVPGSWLAEFPRDGRRAAAPGFLLMPLTDGAAVLLGCAPATGAGTSAPTARAG